MFAENRWAGGLAACVPACLPLKSCSHCLDQVFSYLKCAWKLVNHLLPDSCSFPGSPVFRFPGCWVFVFFKVLRSSDKNYGKQPRNNWSDSANETVNKCSQQELCQTPNCGMHNSASQQCGSTSRVCADGLHPEATAAILPPTLLQVGHNHRLQRLLHQGGLYWLTLPLGVVWWLLGIGDGACAP